MWLRTNVLRVILAAAYCIISPVVAGCAEGHTGGRWSVGILYGKSPFGPFSPCIKRGTCAKNPVITCHDITDVNASDVADPFLYIGGFGEPWYLLFEVFNFDLKRGEIGCSVSHDKVMRLSGRIHDSMIFVCINQLMNK